MIQIILAGAFVAAGLFALAMLLLWPITVDEEQEFVIEEFEVDDDQHWWQR